MSYKKPMGDANVLQRRIVANPKYERVEATVNNGVSVNLAKQMKETEISVKRRDGENFRRIRPSTVVNYIEYKQSQERMKTMQLTAQAMSPEDEADGANFQGFPTEDFMLPQPPKREMIILDVREQEQFEMCHVNGASHFPVLKLNHAMNPFTPEVLNAKNKENVTIVLYDEEEEIVVGRRIANLFFERGCDNVAIISGGLKEFASTNLGYILGEPPFKVVPKTPNRVSRARDEISSRASTSSRSTLADSRATSHKPKSLATSLARRSPSTGGWR